MTIIMETIEPDRHELGSEANIAWCSAHPMDWYAYHIKKIKSRPIYFITFTKQGEVDLDKWKKRVKFELERKFVDKFLAAVEHADDNIHVHVKLYAKRYLKKVHDFKTFIKYYGFVDMRRVNTDNGITQYLEKEGTPVATSGELFAQLPAPPPAQARVDAHPVD